MATQYDTQLQDIYHSINQCKDSLLGFGSSLALENDEQNSAVHFLLNSHAQALGKISIDMLALFNSNKDKDTQN